MNQPSLLLVFELRAVHYSLEIARQCGELCNSFECRSLVDLSTPRTPGDGDGESVRNFQPLGECGIR